MFYYLIYFLKIVGPFLNAEALAAAEAAAKLNDDAIFSLAAYTHDLKALFYI